MAKLVLEKHFELGISKYKGVPDEYLQEVLNRGDISAKVYRFEDGRYLVKFLAANQNILYSSKEELLDKVVLT